MSIIRIGFAVLISILGLPTILLGIQIVGQTLKLKGEYQTVVPFVGMITQEVHDGVIITIVGILLIFIGKTLRKKTIWQTLKFYGFRELALLLIFLAMYPVAYFKVPTHLRMIEDWVLLSKFDLTQEILISIGIVLTAFVVSFLLLEILTPRMWNYSWKEKVIISYTEPDWEVLDGLVNRSISILDLNPSKQIKCLEDAIQHNAFQKFSITLLGDLMASNPGNRIEIHDAFVNAALELKNSEDAKALIKGAMNIMNKATGVTPPEKSKKRQVALPPNYSRPSSSTPDGAGQAVQAKEDKS